jgi:prepilin-type N-terminal cleavage/methylation domain-containing protein
LKTRASKRRAGGFTLVEVMIALAIVAVTAVVLLDQRLAIVQDAGRARDKRICWVLASQKLAELELDKSLWTGIGGGNNGDFSEVDPDYGVFTWEYQIVREPIDTSDPTAAQNQGDDPKKRELFRLTLTVRAPSLEEPIVLEGEFPTTPPPDDASKTDPTKADPSAPSSGTPAPAGGPQK